MFGVSGQEQWLTVHLAGGGNIRVCPKPHHTPAACTVLMFQVDDIEAAVGELARRGVTRGGGPIIAAWFKDPAGNTLEVMQER